MVRSESTGTFVTARLPGVKKIWGAEQNVRRTFLFQMRQSALCYKKRLIDNRPPRGRCFCVRLHFSIFWWKCYERPTWLHDQVLTMLTSRLKQPSFAPPTWPIMAPQCFPDPSYITDLSPPEPYFVPSLPERALWIDCSKYKKFNRRPKWHSKERVLKMVPRV